MYIENKYNKHALIYNAIFNRIENIEYYIPKYFSVKNKIKKKKNFKIIKAEM